MTENTSSSTPHDSVLATLEAFYTIYQELLPSLTKAQLELLARRLERYTREVGDDMSRAPRDPNP
jgi:ribose 1,5-bisphosphokinase PhnN